MGCSIELVIWLLDCFLSFRLSHLILLLKLSSLTFKLMEFHKVKSSLDFSVILFQRQLKISEHFALEKKVKENQVRNSISRVLDSIELLMDSWHKVAISLLEVEL